MRRTKITLVAAPAAGALSACGDASTEAAGRRERLTDALNSRDIIP